MEDLPMSEDYYEPDDPPPKEALDFWYYFNRYCEWVARYARALGML